MVIFGFRRTLATMAMLTLACRNGHVAAHRLIKATRWFTLFFIPRIPYNSKYLTVCAQCGTQVAWSRADAEAAARAPAPTAGTADPVAPPVTTAWHPGEEPRATLPPPTVTAPAGWYPSPGGGTGQRYWSGSAWTDEVLPG